MSPIVTLAVLAALQVTPAPDPARQKIIDRISTMRISVDFQGQEFDQAINYFREYTGLNFFVNAEVYTRYTADQLRVTLKLKDLLVKTALKLMLSGKELALTYHDGVLEILPKDKVAAKLSLQIYDVRDLLLKIQDFPGPEVELKPPTSSVGPGPSFEIQAEKDPVLTESFILEIIKTCTGGKTWEEIPGVAINLTNGLLIVTQSGAVHREIADLINRLRQFK